MASDPHVVPLRVVGDGIERVFGEPFWVGRGEACAVRFEGHARVSRTHLSLSPTAGGWEIEDLESANGLYVDGVRVDRADITVETRIQVGEGGPMLTLTPDTRAQPAAAPEALPDPFARPPDPFAADAFAAMPSADEVAAHVDPFARRPETLPDPPVASLSDPSGLPPAAAPSASPVLPGDPFAPRDHASPDPFAPPSADSGLAADPTPQRGDTPRTAAGFVTDADARTGVLQHAPAEQRGTPESGGHAPHGDAPDSTPKPQSPTPKQLGPDGEPLAYEDVVKHYFTEGGEDDDAGERTMFIRQAYSDIQKATTEVHEAKQTRYRFALISALVVCVLAISYAGYREYTVRQLREQAQELFSQLQTYNVSAAEKVASVERQIEERPEQRDSLRAELTEVLSARQRTAARYDRFVRGLGVYDGLSSEEEAIYSVARAFGESELTIPPEFVDEVKVYVRKWKNSNRFQTAVRRAQVNGYVPITMDALRRNGLPAEFFYLALQESNFETRIVGPPTRYGHAKGAWQFIPETGRRYGLSTGPLVASSAYDPLDERHDFDQAADAAARYLHDIYVHLSQSSGLLVCASYNWGEGRVRRNMDHIRRQLSRAGIPNDPSHRTYWRFLTEYRSQMPHETRDYVMNIFAAAVIGRNPRMFGIDMDPPLAGGGSIVVQDEHADPSRAPRRLGESELQRRAAPPAPLAPDAP